MTSVNRLTIVYCRPFAGLMHFSDTMLATSLNIDSSCTARSWSLICTSPFSRMNLHTSSSSAVPKHSFRRDDFANCPLDTLVNTVVVCSTSERSVSVP